MPEQCIFNQFLKQANLNANLIAIRTAKRTMSYAELDVLSAALAVELLQYSQQQNKVIAIYGKRSAALIVAILACARAGFTFAILDSAYPKERILKMAQVILPAMIIGIDTFDTELQEIFEELSDRTPLLSIDDTYLSRLSSQFKSGEALPVLEIPSQQAAYLLFTSGTTGLPKCIQTSHRPLVHFVDWYVKAFDVKPGAKFSMLSGLGHDPVLRDIFVPLSSGGEINIPETASITNPIKLFDWIRASHIAYIHATPQLLRLLCAGAKDHEALPHLRYVFSGGDVLRMSHVNELKKLANHCKIVNFYGTTETPQAVAFYEITASDVHDPIPIGRGIADVKLHVLKQNLSPAAVGETGQIGIETEYLSDGYFNDQALTHGRFVDAIDAQSTSKIYLSGDHGVRRLDGSVELQGRMDDQVKIRGFRVELGEVTTALEHEAVVQSAVVLPQQAQNGENYLIAYLVKQANTEINDTVTEQIKAAISTKIPAYMVPNHYVWLDILPLLPNGKLDRGRLAELSNAQVEQQRNVDVVENEVVALGSTLDALIKQWGTILNISKINANKSFVELGGDSLSFIQASLTIERNIGWLPEDWEKLPLAAIAKLPKKLGSKTNQVGMSIFIRAFSIALMVVGHFEIFMIKGTTTALFVIAGWSFGKYQLPVILKNDQVKSIFNTVLKIAIPTMCAILLKLALGMKTNWWSLFLLGNNFKDNKEIWSEYWFVLVLIQCLLVFAILFCFKAVREFAKDNEYKFLIAATLTTLLLALIGSHIWDTYGLFHRVVHIKIWLIFLGMSIAFASTLKRKALISAIAITSFTGVWLMGENYSWFERQPFLNPWIEGDPFIWFPLLTILLLIYIPRIKLPQKMSSIVNLLAESSLIIYLSSFAIQKTVKAIYPEADKVVLLVLALVGGVILWKVWEKLTHTLWSFGGKSLTRIYKSDGVI